MSARATKRDGPPRPARLSIVDVLRTGAAGLRSRRMRVVLSALGITIGIAAMVSVVGVSASSQAHLDRQLALLGTNLLTASPGKDLANQAASLPEAAVPMVARIAPVESVSAVGRLPGAKVYRNEYIPAAASNSISVYASRLDLPQALRASVITGSWLNEVSARAPMVVLGAGAAQRLGIDNLADAPRIVVDGRRFTVIGILAPVPLADELDSAAFVGWPSATEYLDFDGHPTTIYTRAGDDSVPDVRSVLARTINPAAPYEVLVSRPSDALAAKAVTDRTFTGLLVGLGAVALLVGGIGVANTMVISVLERRVEIGLRRSLGATRGQIRTQFLIESLLLSILGGIGGVLVGIAVTAGYDELRSWPVVVPLWTTAGGFAATLAIGAVAGLYPAIRAASVTPTEALAGT